MTEYPIPVSRLTGEMALTIICKRCRAEAVIDPDDLLNDDCYECPANTRCRGTACMKYWEGDVCKGCGTLGYFGGGVHGDPLKGCCSRKCMLQAEYAESLKERTS